MGKGKYGILEVSNVTLKDKEGNDMLSFKSENLKKVVRKPEYNKTKMSGLQKDYKKLYDELVQWDRLDNKDTSNLSAIIYGIGYGVGDAPYFGWKGEELEAERKLYNAIENSYRNLLFALEDGLGIESKVYTDQVDENGFYRHK